jgi:small subunit ribosomal protein S3
MGHKVNPTGFRIGVIKNWQGKWYADRHYANYLEEDIKIRRAIEDKYPEAAISSIEIERQANQVVATINTARPGIVIGRGGQRVDEARIYLEKAIGKKIQLNIKEVQQPELDAKLVARSIAEQLERRIAYRRAMKQAMARTLQAGGKGIKVAVAGRLGGAEIARRLNMHEGRVPLHTLRADIDYGFVEAKTVMGRIGVKAWIYKGEILPELKTEESESVAQEPVVVTDNVSSNVTEISEKGNNKLVASEVKDNLQTEKLASTEVSSAVEEKKRIVRPRKKPVARKSTKTTIEGEDSTSETAEAGENNATA